MRYPPPYYIRVSAMTAGLRHFWLIKSEVVSHIQSLELCVQFEGSPVRIWVIP